MNIPRGIRNNNPGNIRHGENWRGLAREQTDPAFCVFTSPVYGIRAMGRILLNYQRLYGLKTVREIVSRWAPPSENDTDAYVAHAAEALGVQPDDELCVSDHLEALLRVIILHENGRNPYSDDALAQGADLARA